MTMAATEAQPVQLGGGAATQGSMPSSPLRRSTGLSAAQTAMPSSPFAAAACQAMPLEEAKEATPVGTPLGSKCSPPRQKHTPPAAIPSSPSATVACQALPPEQEEPIASWRAACSLPMHKHTLPQRPGSEARYVSVMAGAPARHDGPDQHAHGFASPTRLRSDACGDAARTPRLHGARAPGGGAPLAPTPTPAGPRSAGERMHDRGAPWPR